MKIPQYLTLGLTASLLAVAPVGHAAETFSSTMGFYKFDVPVGSSMWVCGLVNATDHQGAMDGMVAGAQTVVTEDDRTFTVNEFGNHYLEILEGAWTGLTFDIVSNTANTITIEGDLSGFAGITGAETFSIREHVTLGDMLPGGGGLTAAFNDSLKLFYPDGTSKTFLFGPVGAGGADAWFLPPATLADDEVVYPGQGFVINASAAATLLIGENGVSHVKETPTYIPLYGGVVNLVGPLNPLVATSGSDPIFPSQFTLAESGLSSTLGVFTDSVSLYPRTGSLSSTGTYLVADVGAGPFFLLPPDIPSDDVSVDVGAAMVISVGSDLLYQSPVLH